MPEQLNVPGARGKLVNAKKNRLSLIAGSSSPATEAALDVHASEQELEDLFEQAPQPMWLYDLATLKFLHVNQAAIDEYGYSRREFLSMSIKDIRPADDIGRLEARIADVRAGVGAYDSVSQYWRHVRNNGDIIWVDIHNQATRYKGREAGLVVAVNVTERKLTQERLDIQRAYFRQLFDSSSDAILLLDLSDSIADANRSFLELFEYELSEVVGARIDNLIVPDTRQDETARKWAALHENGYVYYETRRMRKSGTMLDVAVAGYPVILDSKRRGAYLIYKDLTEKKQLLKKVRYHSTHSAATGLINRSELERQIRLLLTRPRGTARFHAVLHVALDQFMLVSRTCGHAAALQLLKRVVDCIQAVAKSSKVAHLYADEFCVLLSRTNREKTQMIARQIIEDVAEITFRWNGLVYKIGANVGGIMLPASSNADQSILPMAEMACQIAKDKGTNRMHIAEIGDNEAVRRHHEVHWLSQIHEALDADRFVLYGQRMLSVDGSDKCKDHEVLLRMLDHDGNVVSPGQFIPVAERFRLMGQIDRWVLNRLFTMLDEMATKGRRFNGRVSVNLSGATLSEEDLTESIQSLFERYQVSPANICFEITETAAIQNIASAARFVADMQALGIKIALDDFGSGMSSFKYLRELPIDYLKIDGLFIREIIANDADRAMTEAISRMAQALGIRTIAECVENPETLDCLRELGVDYAQGFAIHRPEPLTVDMLS